MAQREKKTQKPCRLVYDAGEFGGELVFDFTNWNDAIDFWKQKNPPGALVRKIYLYNLADHSVFVTIPGRKRGAFVVSGIKYVFKNELFSQEAYNKAIEDRKWDSEYFRKTGKRWRSEAGHDQDETRPGIGGNQQRLNREACLRILGLDGDFSEASLKKAYRAKVRMNHPDRVASLDAEFRELAERKTKLINRAYESLKKTLP